MKSKTGTKIGVVAAAVLLLLCIFTIGNRSAHSIDKYDEMEVEAHLYPYMQGTVIPPNIAPLNFRIEEAGDTYQVRWSVPGKDSFEFKSEADVRIPERKWKKLLEKHPGEKLILDVFVKRNGDWHHYPSITYQVAEEKIDPYVAYRLIEPGYETWGSMGIYQRCLENFKETPIMKNSLTDHNCMNCHSFRNYNPDTMLFHVRAKHGGTVIAQGNNIRKVDTKTPETISAGVYPRWHTGGRYVAFSTNTTRQNFHSTNPNRVEVYDLASDIILYDTETQTVWSDSLLSSTESFETFPEWSPDGKYLYFCTAPAVDMPLQYDSLRYDVCRVAFDASTARFLPPVDTLIPARKTHKSVVMPRVSPDNQSLICCLSDYGTFPIWHKENDLYLLDLNTREWSALADVNSTESDSYHAWSSNGRWLVFGSRRLDGLYTRLFIAYYDKEGRMHSPILLPQRDPGYYDYSLKSYNIPEFIRGKVKVSPYQFQQVIR